MRRAISREQILSAQGAVDERADVVPAGRRRGSRLQTARRPRGSRRGVRGRQAGAGRARLPGSPGPCARSRARQRRRARRSFQWRFTTLFVDEFQDTDPLQAELLVLLAADESSLDPTHPDWRRGRRPARRAVHRRRSEAVDLPLPPRRRRRLSRRLRHASRPAAPSRVPLKASFRATPTMQRAINAAFAPVMQDDPVTLQAAYMPLTEVRDDWPDQPSVDRAAGAAAVRPRASRSPATPSRSRCPTRWARSSRGSSTRASGKSPNGRASRPCRSRPVTSACCSAGSPAGRRT